MRYMAPGCRVPFGQCKMLRGELPRRFRAECLNRQWFHTVREAAVVVAVWWNRGEETTIRRDYTVAWATCRPISDWGHTNLTRTI
jgi:hypothetical protein